MLPSLLLLSLSFVSVYSLPNAHGAHKHVERTSLPSKWYHDDDHPVHELFKRAPTDGVAYPPVGSPAWVAAFPPPNQPLDIKALPAQWIRALDAAIAAGRIPDIPTSIIPDSSAVAIDPVYPAGVDPSSASVCSSTAKCRMEGDFWDAPDGVFAHSFDDGPYGGTLKLVNFMVTQRAPTTHFMIGAHIIARPTEFLAAFNAGHDIAVHTWSHPHMTTKSNLEILGELGWTMQLIHHSTGGRVPRYWRPPYGDSDRRVGAIAKSVFGLDTVIWNRDTDDWGLTIGATNTSNIQTKMQEWITGPKAPGVMHLQHEVMESSVDAFINVYPLLQENGWQAGSLASVLADRRAYQNAAGSKSNDVIARPDMNLPFSPVPPRSHTTTTTTSTTSTPTPSSTNSPGVSSSSQSRPPSNTNSPGSSDDGGLAPSPSAEPGSASMAASNAWIAYLAACAALTSFAL